MQILCLMSKWKGTFKTTLKKSNIVFGDKLSKENKDEH